VSEKDAQVYQDYQERKMSPADFLAYLAGRRDAFDPSSPKWAEADRRLRDAEESVKNTALAARDQDVFNRYGAGKLSDNTYLVYIKKRIDAMAPDDPTRPEWQHKLTQMAHSLAEDKLRHDVATATTAAGEATARKNLSDFYKAYKMTLNPGSAEYRATEERILALKPALVSTGGGGGGGGGGPNAVLVPKGTPKIILSTASFDAALAMLSPDASTPKKVQAATAAMLRTNLDSANTALSNRDKVWLYTDPRYPGQTVTRRNPDGTTWRDPVTRKSEKVLGSSYRAVSSDEVAEMQMATYHYQTGLAVVAAAKGDTKAYGTALWHARNALDAARTTQAHAVLRNIEPQLKAIDAGVEVATKLNDPATVLNLLRMKGDVIRAAIEDAHLDLAQVERLEKAGLKIEDNILLPVWQTNIDGTPYLGPDGRRVQIGGAVDVANSPRNADGTLIAGMAVLNPGYHFVLDRKGPWETVEEAKEGYEPGMWGLDHIQVQTGAFGRVVTGEVQVGTAPTQPKIAFTDTKGVSHTAEYGGGASYFSFIDGDGNRVHGYSIDGGATWVQATGGIPPVLQVNVPLTPTTDKDGNVTYTDPDGNVLFKFDAATGGWSTNVPAAGRGGQISWFGQAAAESGGDISLGVGAPGQRFRIVTAEAGPNGLPSLNLIPNSILMDVANAERRIATARSVFAAGMAPGATLAEESAALRTRGLLGGELPAARTAATDAAALKAAAEARRVNVFAAGMAPGATLAEESAALRMRGTLPGATSQPAFDAGTLVSTLATAAAPVIASIIYLGQTLLSVLTPPPTAPVLRPLYEPPVLKPVTTTPPRVPTGNVGPTSMPIVRAIPTPTGNVGPTPMPIVRAPTPQPPPNTRYGPSPI
jgi:hypothetical protein